VLVLDGVGEHSSTTLWHGSGDTLRGVESIDFPHSIGLLYAALTAYLGFEVNEGEYKVMGLSAWGRPRFREEMQRLVQIHEDGSYTLELSYFDHMTDCELGFGATLERLLGPRRPPGKPWTLDADDLRYADIAASLQATTEDVMLALAGRVRARSGSQHLCLAGGVALNAVANARLQREAGFERVFVQPAAGDAGGALGAAIDVALELGDPRPAALATAALGQRIDAGRAKEVAAALGLEARRVQDPALELAHRIARGDIVALTDGRFEWGPRALGGRSILADPSRRSTRDRLNRLIKQREPFRPFAPAVLEQHAPAWFETEANDMTPYMTTVAPVRAGRREALAAVTHEDGTARLQTVTATSAPALHAVLDQLHAQTGVPVVLNTSLNGPGEPIVGSAEDALAFFLRHKVDALIVEDVLVERKS
jgi:carbamoyltransferase